MVAIKKEKELIKIEGNFIELFPIHFDRKKSLTKGFTETFKNKHGEVMIKHWSRFFNGFDMDLFIALLSLFKKNNEQQQINILPGDLIDELGLKDDKKLRKRVLNFFFEFASTSVENNGAWRGPDGSYKSVTSNFNLFNFSFVLKDKIKQNAKLNNPEAARKESYLKFSDEFFASIKLGNYFKLIDFAVYRELPSGMTRFAYVYIEKRLGTKRDYQENFNKFVTSIIFKNPTAKDKRLFKFRILKSLEHLYQFNFEGDNIIIHRKILLKTKPIGLLTGRKELSEHDHYVLEKACEYCGRKDKLFVNVIKKYISLLGSEMVDQLMGEVKIYDPEVKSKSRYLIHLLKDSAPKK